MYLQHDLTLYSGHIRIHSTEHEQLNELLNHIKNKQQCKDYIQTSLRRQNAERSDITKQKTGINTILVFIHYK